MVHHSFNKASFAWKRQNPDSAQRDAIETIFHTYFGVTWNITSVITSSIDAITFFCVGFYNSWIFGVVSIFGCLVLTRIRRHYSQTLDQIDSAINESTKTLRIKNSNQYTFRSDRLVNPLTESIMEPHQYDPINGHSNIIMVWDERDRISEQLTFGNDVIKSCILISLSLYMTTNQQMVLWILLNGSKLFGLSDILTRTDEIKNLSSSRVASHLRIFDESLSNTDIEICIDMCSHNPVTSYSSPSMERKTTDLGSTQLNDIKIGKIDMQMDGGYRLESLTPVSIDFSKPGFVMMNGPKGCGKSLTIDLFAGMYDGTVCSGTMNVNGRLSTDEFNTQLLRKNTFYIQQLVSDRYRQNKVNTLAMSLRELFPGASFQQIKEYLTHFDLLKKLPSGTTKPDVLDVQLGKNERSFSPGELQAFVLATQLYKAKQLGVKLLLLDEPERNIDYETVKKIFDNVIIPLVTKREMTIVMITHNDTLKTYLKDQAVVKSVLQFDSHDKHLLFRQVQF